VQNYKYEQGFYFSVSEMKNNIFLSFFRHPSRVIIIFGVFFVCYLLVIQNGNGPKLPEVSYTIV